MDCRFNRRLTRKTAWALNTFRTFIVFVCVLFLLLFLLLLMPVVVNVFCSVIKVSKSLLGIDVSQCLHINVLLYTLCETVKTACKEEPIVHFFFVYSSMSVWLSDFFFVSLVCSLRRIEERKKRSRRRRRRWNVRTLPSYTTKQVVLHVVRKSMQSILFMMFRCRFINRIRWWILHYFHNELMKYKFNTHLPLSLFFLQNQ